MDLVRPYRHQCSHSSIIFEEVVMPAMPMAYYVGAGYLNALTGDNRLADDHRDVRGIIDLSILQLSRDAELSEIVK